jgi:hypothetical protein
MPIQMNSSLASGPSGSESSCGLGLDGNACVGLAPVLTAIAALPYLGQTAASEQHAPTPTTARHPDGGQILELVELAAPRDEQPQRSGQAGHRAALCAQREVVGYKRSPMWGPLVPALATSARRCGGRWSWPGALSYTTGVVPSPGGELGRRLIITREKKE